MKSSIKVGSSDDTWYSQATDIQDFYGDNLKLATAEQTNFTIDMKQQLVQDTSDSDATAAGGRGAGGRGKAKKSSKAKRIAKAAAALSTVSETSQMDYHQHHHHHQEVNCQEIGLILIAAITD